MKDTNIIKEIFENPALIKNLSMDKIDNWISEAPYVQYLHLLKALKLKSLGVNDLKAYHKIATVVTDRIKMNELLEGIEEKRSQKKVTNKKIADKTVKDSKSNKKTTNSSSVKRIEKLQDESHKQAISIVEMENRDTQNQNTDNLVNTQTSKSFIKKDDKQLLDRAGDMEEEKNIEANDEENYSFKSRSELSEFSEWLLVLDGRNDEINEDQVGQSVSIDGAAISETLAKLMEKQGHVDKAIEMYEKLCLINPEKSAYFAALIEKLKKQ